MQRQNDHFEMNNEKIKNKGAARIFENDFLELLTKNHPLVVYVMYFPTIGFLLYFGHTAKHISITTEVCWFLAGIFFWSFFEYIMHRYLFHLQPRSAGLKRFVYTLHGVHHEYPRDKTRLFMPPVPSIIIATLLFFIMYLLIGWLALAFFPGFLLGYILYGSMHYAIHAFPPPRFMKSLWRYHTMHHYKHPDKGYGVSSIFWDKVFGTAPSDEQETA